MTPAQDLGQAVSSVNSYCTIILEFLVVRDIHIISVKLRCLHPTFSLVTLVRGVGVKLSRLVYLPPPRPAQGLSQALSSVNSYCTITLEYLVVRVVNIIPIKLRYLRSNVQFGYPCPRGGGKLSRLVYLAPPHHPGFESGISQFGIYSCESSEHYFSQTEIFRSNVQFGYPCPRGGVGGGASCPGWFIEILGGGKINRPGQLAPNPLSIRNPTENLK